MSYVAVTKGLARQLLSTFDKLRMNGDKLDERRQAQDERLSQDELRMNEHSWAYGRAGVVLLLRAGRGRPAAGGGNVGGPAQGGRGRTRPACDRRRSAAAATGSGPADLGWREDFSPALALKLSAPRRVDTLLLPLTAFASG